jgi:cytochrome oxidase Cu insertion factor (SCO1/SenC/PrrC family)
MLLERSPIPSPRLFGVTMTALRFATLVRAMAVVTVLVLGCQKAPERAIDRPLGAKPEAPQPVVEKVEPGEPAAPFALTDQRGEPFDSASLKGKVWLGSVFFSNCPGPCFRENQAVADILRKIDDPNFVAVSLTCDPDTDTPDVLRRYADRFEANPDRWKFLTGDMAVIKKVANDTFFLPAEVGVHSERGVVFDRQGRLRGGYHLLQPDRVELLEKLIREVLAEKAP